MPNPTTGRLEVSFLGNPQLPFSDLTLALNGGPRAPLANPLVCGGAKTESDFHRLLRRRHPQTVHAVFRLPHHRLPVLDPLRPGPIRHAREHHRRRLQPLHVQPLPCRRPAVPLAGLHDAARGPARRIPSVTLCGEPQAAAGTCSAASQIGVATVTAGAGTEPYPLSGPVYLTGPYDGAPYGLSIPVSVIAGPFNLGTVTTRATIKVNPTTARVTVATTNLPTIVGGVPVRLKTLKVEVNRPDFIFNPTNCGPPSRRNRRSPPRSTRPSPSPARSRSAAAPRSPFKPVFKVSTSAKTSKKNGASLQVSLTQPAHEANIKSVFVSLPKQLPSRLTTLQKACPEATFAANPVNCRKLGSEVGSAAVTTPVLPGTAERFGLPRLPRRRGLPRPRHRARRRRRHRDPHRQHENHERGHELDLRGDPRRARLELRADAARQATLGADGDRQPLFEGAAVPTTITARAARSSSRRPSSPCPAAPCRFSATRSSATS